MDPKSMEMAMILTIDALGKRYGRLPSEVITQANTFDLVIMDAAMTFEHHVNKDPNTPPDVSQEQLQKIMERARGNQS